MPFKIFQNPSKNIKKSLFIIPKLLYISQNPNLPSKKIGIPYFRILLYSEDWEQL